MGAVNTDSEKTVGIQFAESECWCNVVVVVRICQEHGQFDDSHNSTQCACFDGHSDEPNDDRVGIVKGAASTPEIVSHGRSDDDVACCSSCKPYL